MSSETRSFRPFIGIAGFERAIADTRLLVGDRCLEPNGRALLTSREFLTEPVILKLDPDALLEQASDVSLQLDALSLVVVMRSRRLREAHVTQVPIADVQPELVIAPSDTNERPTPMKAPFGGCDVVAYVALTAELEPAPLRPWRYGTWLANASFTIATELGDVGLVPHPLDDAERDRLQLASGTLRYLEFDSALLASPELVEYYVDAELLDALASDQHGATSKALQRELFLYAMSTLTQAASRELTSNQSVIAHSDLEGTMIGALLNRLSAGHRGDALAATKDALFKQLRQNPQVIVALLEDSIQDLQRSWIDAIKGS